MEEDLKGGEEKGQDRRRKEWERREEAGQNMKEEVFMPVPTK